MIAVIDTGIKRSIVRNLMQRGARVALYPARARPRSCSRTTQTRCSSQMARATPRRSTMSWIRCASSSARSLCGAYASATSCCAARWVSQTYKLPFGHRGANHPVKDLQTGRVEITSQNHGFAVLGPGGARTIDSDEPVRWETDFGAAQLTHVNLYDRTVEGFELLDVPGGAVQYHPEAGPGPHDTRHLFDRFLERIAAA